VLKVEPLSFGFVPDAIGTKAAGACLDFFTCWGGMPRYSCARNCPQPSPCGRCWMPSGSAPTDLPKSPIHHQADIEDLYQQTCVVLWNKHEQYDGNRDFFRWACGFAKHEWIMNSPANGTFATVFRSVSCV